MPLDYLTNCAVVINDSSGNNAERVVTSTPTFSLIQEAKADIKRMKQSITESKFTADISRPSQIIPNNQTIGFLAAGSYLF